MPCNSPSDPPKTPLQIVYSAYADLTSETDLLHNFEVFRAALIDAATASGIDSHSFSVALSTLQFADAAASELAFHGGPEDRLRELCKQVYQLLPY